MIPANNIPAADYGSVEKTGQTGVPRDWACGLIAGLALIFLAGCQVPPAPPHAAQQGPPSGQNDEGWLWRQLRGEDKPKTPPPAAQPQPPPTPPPQTQYPAQYPQQGSPQYPA